MAEKDIAITYETLFELLRIEKNREDLQKLDPAFFEDVLQYLRQKKAAFDSKPVSQTLLFEKDDKERTRQELENIRKIIKDLYDRREKKIVLTSINKSRTGMTLVNAANMLPSEKQLFNRMTDILTDSRKNTLYKLISGEMPEVPVLPKEDNRRQDAGNAFSAAETGNENGYDTGGLHFRTSENGLRSAEETKELKSTPVSSQEGEKRKLVRFLAPIEEIVGPDLQIYGPYDEGSEIALPVELARVLVEKDQAEEI